jgi:hypothetical protein
MSSSCEEMYGYLELIGRARLILETEFFLLNLFPYRDVSRD